MRLDHEISLPKEDMGKLLPRLIYRGDRLSKFSRAFAAAIIRFLLPASIYLTCSIQPHSFFHLYCQRAFDHFKIFTKRLPMPPNQAAWLTQPKTSHPLEVKEAPYTAPKANEVVVKVHAVAINPIDWFKAGKGYGFVFSYIKLPFVQGTDLAGEVVEVGPGVSRLKVGDRVLSFALGVNKNFNTSAKGAFQLYTICLDHMTSPIPDSMSYEEASVIPLGATTAACALFQPDQLHLQYPKFPCKPTGKTVLIWGGSTSVGCNAIQLAVAAGYEVVTTCSPKNFALCQKLGASQCLDYNSRTVVPDLIRTLKTTDFAGALSVGVNSDGPCFEVVNKCKSGKFVSMISFPQQNPEPKFLVLPRTIGFFASWFLTTTIKTTVKGIGWKLAMVDAVSHNGVGKAIYTDYLPRALAEGSYIAAPEPEIVGTGLEHIQTAYHRQEKGMSAKKAVVTVQ